MAFKDGTKTLGTAKLGPIAGVATASFATKAPGQGQHAISAVFLGDPSDLTSSSKALAVKVGRFHSSVTVAASVNPSVFGQSLTLTATVNGVGKGAVIPTGSTTFMDGSITLGTAKLATVDGVARAAFTTLSLAPGHHAIAVIYGGDSNDLTSNSAAQNVTVSKDASVSSVASSVAKSVFGQSVTFSATVSASAPGAGRPTGAVTFKSGSTILGIGTLSTVKGVTTARFTTPGIAVGQSTITAVYGGDQDFKASTSKSITQTVGQASTKTALTASRNSITAGTVVDLTALVVPVAPGVGTPVDSVTFLDGTNVLGTLALTDGTATLSVTTLAKGKHTLTAVYFGESRYLKSTSAPLTVTVM